MAKYILFAQIGGPSLKKAVCEICGKQYASISTAYACEASHFKDLNTAEKRRTNGK